LALLAVALLVLANAFFVASEFAIVAVRRSRLDQLAAEGSAAARSATEVVRHLDTYIAACQLGITMASLALGWIGEPAFSGLIDPPIAALVGQSAHETAQALSAAASFGLVTTLHIVLGELAPKGLALQRTESTALAIARPLRLFATIFHWPIAALNGVGNCVLRLLGLKPTSGHERVHSVEELGLLVTGMQDAGVVDASEARIARRAFHFGDVTAAQLMTPRTDIEAVPRDSSLCDLLDRAVSTSHSRWLVFDGSLDNIVGALPVRSLFSALHQPSGYFDLDSHIAPVMAVPSSKSADELLGLLRTDSQQIAVVLDEYGGTAGMLTLQDTMKALVGSRQPETNAEGSHVLDGLTRLGELDELVGIAVDDETLEVDTLGGLVMQRLGRLPAPGDEVRIDDWRIRVEAVEARRATRLSLQKSA
jgi:putative hemolysin